MTINKTQGTINKLLKVFFDKEEKQKKFIHGKTLIQYAGAVFDEEELVAMIEILCNRWFGLADKSRHFENKVAHWLGKKFGIVVNSGSSANLLAFATLRSPNVDNPMKNGDEVIAAASAFPTSVNPIIQNNFKPVFVDVKMGTYVIDLDEVERAVSTKTRAILFAHTLGNSPDMNRLSEILKKYNLVFIEDCCDALGSKFNDKLLGSFGTFSTTSFYPAHHITIGEGGFLATNNKNLFQITRSLRDWGRACYCEGTESLKEQGACGKRFSHWLEGIDERVDHKYVYSEIGYNLKPLELQCAMGLVQLQRLQKFIERRKENFKFYFEHLKKWSEYFYLPEWLPNVDVSWFAFPITVKPMAPFKRIDIVKWLEDHKIQTRPIFAGNLLRHPAYKNLDCRIVGNLVNSDVMCTNSFFVGVYPGITNEMRSYVIEKFEEFLKKY